MTSLCFIVPLAPKERKKNWIKACDDLNQTLNSIQNSTNKKYSVIVVSHDNINCEKDFDNRIHFIKVNYDLPFVLNKRVSSRHDKLKKISIGWDYAKKYLNPRYIMKLDADDLISRYMVNWVDQFATGPGYLIRHGWIWNEGQKYLIQKTETLDRICGSCLIIRSDIADLEGPFRTEVEGVILSEEGSKFAAEDQTEIVPGSERCTLLLNESHQRYEAQFKYLGHHLETLPLHAVVYRDSNLDSMGMGNLHQQTLRMQLGKLRRTRIINKSIRNEFLIP
jgi:thiol-disulfide isomerase/thioredoxin